MGERVHDLPRFWDGFAVDWSGWEYQATAFICPPRREAEDVCQGCGTAKTHRGFPTESVSKGRLARSSVTTHADIAASDARINALPLWAPIKPVALWSLFVWRCPECRLDTVWDTRTNEWWTLDDSDYSDEGSTFSATSKETSHA